jgi:hypothetical protein
VDSVTPAQGSRKVITSMDRVSGILKIGGAETRAPTRSGAASGDGTHRRVVAPSADLAGSIVRSALAGRHRFGLRRCCRAGRQIQQRQALASRSVKAAKADQHPNLSHGNPHVEGSWRHCGRS